MIDLGGHIQQSIMAVTVCHNSIYGCILRKNSLLQVLLLLYLNARPIMCGICDAGSDVSLVQLTSNPQNLSNIRPGDSVIFTCTTSESIIQQWSSVHYVGDGGWLLFFGVDEMQGREKRTPNNVSVANLTVVNGLMLESELHIIISADYPTSNVSCINNARQVNATICFSVAMADAAAPQVGESSLRSGINGSCVAQLSWSAPGNIDIKDISHYEVKFCRVPITNQTNDANEELSAINSGCYCNSSYEFSVYAVNKYGHPGASSTTTLDPPTPSRGLPVCDTQTKLSSDATTTEATGTTQISEQRKRWSGKMMVTSTRNRAVQHNRFIFSFDFLCDDCSTGCSWRIKN